MKPPNINMIRMFIPKDSLRSLIKAQNEWFVTKATIGQIDRELQMYNVQCLSRSKFLFQTMPPVWAVSWANGFKLFAKHRTVLDLKRRDARLWLTSASVSPDLMNDPYWPTWPRPVPALEALGGPSFPASPPLLLHGEPWCPLRASAPLCIRGCRPLSWPTTPRRLLGRQLRWRSSSWPDRLLTRQTPPQCLP